MARDFFYKPEGAWAADFIPFFANGRYRLFYLHDWRNRDKFGEGTPWYQISTTDFVEFTEHGEMLPRGTKDEQDLYVFTGSVLEAKGQYHIFYTGHNPYLAEKGRPMQGVMHAVSDDLLQWRKLPEDTFYAPADRYEPHDWRDPFVFWNEEAGEYWMLLAARQKTGPSRRRGCTALCASTDLKDWDVREPLWTPELYYTHECPDLFKMGEWWYLLFSEFTDRCVTRYRMSRTLRGPWIAPDNDTFDGRAFYAAKTATDGARRYIFGWNPTRDQEKDYQGWHWGGNLVVHEVFQESDGTLWVRLPQTIDDAFARPQAFELKPRMGNCKIGRNSATINVPGSFGCATGGPLPGRCKIQTRVEFTPDTHGFGLMLRVSEDLEQAYYIRLEPPMNRLVLDSWPRPGDVPFMVELERPVELIVDEPIDLTVVLDGTVCEVYAAGEIAMSTRLYNLKTGDWGVFVQEGAAKFDAISLSVP